jgi:hypothetical protein
VTRRLLELIHRYEEMTPEMRPQDPSMKGIGLTFTTLEHGGDEDDLMPQAILLTDERGRSCRYEAVKVGGKVVRSSGLTTRMVGTDEVFDQPQSELPLDAGAARAPQPVGAAAPQPRRPFPAAPPDLDRSVDRDPADDPADGEGSGT